MAKDGNGVCPRCQAYTGPVGTPCIRPECARGGYHCIPVDWYDAAKAYSARKGRPIDPHVGRMIDRYLLAGNLGEGGMGSVYVAIQKPLFREVALKVIGDMDLTRHAVGRFEREARAISLLDHPNIVKIFDYGVGQLDKKVPYMALEYLRHGRTLRKAFAGGPKGGKVDGALVLTLFRQVLNALGAAHAVGIVHRDIKPENVMIVPVHGDPNLVKVLDFGLARMDSDDTAFEGDQAAQGRLAGTPYYMAPEQIPRKGVSVELDGRADLFAVAVMLFEILTGVRPYDGDSPLSVLAKKLDPAFDPMALPEAKALPKKATALLAKGLARDPAQRFATAGEMLEALEKALETRTSAMGLVVKPSESSQDRIQAPPSTPPDPPAEPAPAAPPTPPPPPPPVSPFVPQSRFQKRPGALEVDIPDTPTGPLPNVRPDGPPPADPVTGPVQRPAPLPRPERPARPAPARPRDPATSRWVVTALVSAGILAGLLALVPWVLTSMRQSRAEEDMAALKGGLVRGDRFTGFEDGRVRPDGADYVVLGARAAGAEAPAPVRDPWGNPYRVRFVLDRNTYVLRSDGPDGVGGACRGEEPSADDLCVVLGGR